MKLFGHYSRPNFGVIRRANRTATARNDIVGRRAPQHIIVRRMNPALNMKSPCMAVSDFGIDCIREKRLVDCVDESCPTAREGEGATAEFTVISGSSGFGFCGDAAEQCGGFACGCLCSHYGNRITQR